LGELFEKGLADPHANTQDDIARFWSLDPIFEEIPMKRFVENYRKTAATWIRGKGIQGIRRRDIKFKKPEEETTAVEQEVFTFATVNTGHQEDTMMQTSTTNSTGGYAYKNDEFKWEPRFQSSKYVALGYYREELIIVPPASFDGSLGSWKATFEEDKTVFVLKLAPPPILGDMNAVNNYYAKCHGIRSSRHSYRYDAFSDSSASLGKKWYTFRYHLDWPGKPSMDLGSIKWFEFPTIADATLRKTPLLIINLSSVKPKRVEMVVEDVEMYGHVLTRPSVVTPVKPPTPKSNTGSDEIKAFLEKLLMAGVALDTMPADVQEAAKKYGIGPYADAPKKPDKRPRM